MSDFNTLLAVKDLISQNIVTAESSITVSESAKIMAQKDISSVILTNTGGELAGIITETDIVRKVVAEKIDPEKATAESAMNSEVHKINGDASIFEARQKMSDLHKEFNVKHMVVEENGKPLGLVSATALLGSG